MKHLILFLVLLFSFAHADCVWSESIKGDSHDFKGKVITVHNACLKGTLYIGSVESEGFSGYRIGAISPVFVDGKTVPCSCEQTKKTLTKTQGNFTEEVEIYEK